MKILAIAFTLLAFAQPALADRELIHISDGCPPTVRDDEPRQGAKCGGENACRKSGQHVRWEIDNKPSEQFSVTFTDTSLFENYGQGLCRSSSGSTGKIQCKLVSELQPGAEYSYTVAIGSCLMDPKIIIH